MTGGLRPDIFDPPGFVNDVEVDYYEPVFILTHALL